MAAYFYTGVIGKYGLREENGVLTHLWFGQNQLPETFQDEIKETPLLKQAKDQLDAYFAGKLKEFSLPLAPNGTPFQQKIWQLLQQIPYGETRTYGQLACQAGNPKASRAVGMANNRNPLPVFIPCHRVIGANGTLTGYAGGMDMKQTLLDIEHSK